MTRNQKIFRLKRAGMSSAFLAKHYGLNRTYVDFIVRRQERIEAEAGKPISQLPIRARNVIHNEFGHSDVTPQMVADHLTASALAEIPNCGVVSVRQIEAWLRGHGLFLRDKRLPTKAASAEQQRTCW